MGKGFPYSVSGRGQGHARRRPRREQRPSAGDHPLRRQRRAEPDEERSAASHPGRRAEEVVPRTPDAIERDVEDVGPLHGHARRAHRPSESAARACGADMAGRGLRQIRRRLRRRSTRRSTTPCATRASPVSSPSPATGTASGRAAWRRRCRRRLRAGGRRVHHRLDLGPGSRRGDGAPHSRRTSRCARST